MNKKFGVALLQFLFLTLALATRQSFFFNSYYDVSKTVSNDEIMRKVPRGPSNITSPPTPVFPVADVGFKREIPRKGPSNVKSPSFSLFSIADIGVNRKVPNGPNHDTSPPTSQILVTDIGVKREIPRNDPNKITSRSIPTVSIADNNF